MVKRLGKGIIRGPHIKSFAMKRTFLFLLAAVLLGVGVSSCDKENNNGGNNGSGTTSLQWVDLGLPSGLLWADRNVGAKSAEDYGNYYAWGETAPKEVYDWTTYAYSNDYAQLTKYCDMSDHGLDGFTDNLTTLEASDDAATVNIGGGARTPTKDEWRELMDNTTRSLTTRNGVYGCLFTASNGKSLFLPAAGEYSYNPGEVLYAGSTGSYWSSTLHLSDMVGPSCAWHFSFSGLGMNSRPFGCSVRAVRAR